MSRADTATATHVAPPPRDPVEPGRCAALAHLSDPHTPCGRPARPYPAGWRCDRHRPRTRREGP